MTFSGKPSLGYLPGLIFFRILGGCHGPGGLPLGTKVAGRRYRVTNNHIKTHTLEPESTTVITP